MKILIIGIVASGKTTLAKQLSEKLNTQYYEIDSIVHNDLNNTKRTDKEQKQIIGNIDKNKDWIIEGTLRKNLYYLLDLADKVIYLDIPLHIRKKRILTRFMRQKLGLEECNYKPTLKMLKLMYKWTKDYENKREDFEKHLNNYSNKLIKLTNIEDLEINNDYTKTKKK